MTVVVVFTLCVCVCGGRGIMLPARYYDPPPPPRETPSSHCNATGSFHALLELSVKIHPLTLLWMTGM